MAYSMLFYIHTDIFYCDVLNKDIIKNYNKSWVNARIKISSEKIRHSVGTISVVCAILHKLYGSRFTAIIMAPSLAGVTTVFKRRAFTGYVAVYTYCLTQNLCRC
jgi:hypothetical protein